MAEMEGGRIFTTKKSDDFLSSRSKNHSGSSPVSSLMTFDKRDFSNPSATSLMRCGIQMTYRT